jgi:hypothetical protein
MDQYGTADYLPHPKPVCEKAHFAQAVIGKEDGEIAGVVAVGLLIGVPVSSCGEEGVVWIANAAVSIHMHMKAMGADWISAGRGRLVGGESGHLY